jgi:NADH:ubiquinone oxidoreductase subunit
MIRHKLQRAGRREGSFVFDFLKQLFTWWNGQTLGLRFFTWRRGEFVGQDEFGNRYYRAPSHIPQSIPEHRWVVYNGYAEASKVPPGWYGWIHHIVDDPPSVQSYTPYAWEKPHTPNLTGTPLAYHPPGSIAGTRRPPPVKPDYEAWTPD